MLRVQVKGSNTWERRVEMTGVNLKFEINQLRLFDLAYLRFISHEYRYYRQYGDHVSQINPRLVLIKLYC